MTNEQMQQCMIKNFDNIQKVKKKEKLKEKYKLASFFFLVLFRNNK